MTTSEPAAAPEASARDRAGDAVAAALALAGGLAIAWLDVRVTEVIVSLVPLLLFSIALGFAQPRHAWRWGVLIGIGIPIAHASHALGVPVAPSTSAFGPWLALLPALVGALVGAALRMATRAIG